MILYCKDSLGCIDNNNIELINNAYYWQHLSCLDYIFLEKNRHEVHYFSF